MSAHAKQLRIVPDPDAEPDTIRVVVADDHPLMIAGIRRALERHEDIEVIGEAHSGGELLGMVERRRPEIVLMDLRMPGTSGIECIAELRLRRPEAKVVVLSACDERATIDAALRAGAAAYILKSAHAVDLAAVLRQAVSGAVFHAPSTPRAAPSRSDTSVALTAREQAILEAVAAGLTTAAISRELWVSEHTVKFHLTNIYRKLGVSNRAGAVRYALAHHLVAV